MGGGPALCAGPSWFERSVGRGPALCAGPSWFKGSVGRGPALCAGPFWFERGVGDAWRRWRRAPAGTGAESEILASGTGGNGSGKRDPGAGHRRNRWPVVVRTGRMVYNKR